MIFSENFCVKDFSLGETIIVADTLTGHQEKAVHQNCKNSRQNLLYLIVFYLSILIENYD